MSQDRVAQRVRFRDTDQMPQMQLPMFPAGLTAINQNIGFQCESGKVVYFGCLTVLGTATGHHAVSLGGVQTVAYGNFKLSQNGVSAAGETGTAPSTRFR